MLLSANVIISIKYEVKCNKKSMQGAFDERSGFEVDVDDATL